MEFKNKNKTFKFCDFRLEPCDPEQARKLEYKIFQKIKYAFSFETNLKLKRRE